MKNNFETKAKRVYAVFAAVLMILMVFVVPAFAADDPLQVVNNLSDFIFSLIRAIGLILLGFGILQIGLALKSHDASQRANGMLTVAGHWIQHIEGGLIEHLGRPPTSRH